MDNLDQLIGKQVSDIEYHLSLTENTVIDLIISFTDGTVLFLDGFLLGDPNFEHYSLIEWEIIENK